MTEPSLEIDTSKQPELRIMQAKRELFDHLEYKYQSAYRAGEDITSKVVTEWIVAWVNEKFPTVITLDEFSVTYEPNDNLMIIDGLFKQLF